MHSIIKKIPSKHILQTLTPLHSLSTLSTPTPNPNPNPTPTPQKLELIATELLSLNPVELHDYSILFRLKMGLKNSAPSTLSSGPTSAQPNKGEPEKPKEKTIFDVKLEKFDAASKIKIIKEVRSFTELGLKEAKDLVEKTPSFLKKGVTKEEGDGIVEKLKALGAVVVLE